MSSVLSKAYKAVLKPHRVPGYARRQLDAYLYTVMATRIVWPEPGRAVLVDFALHRPSGQEVLVRTEASLVSPGTERAFFNGQPNARQVYPFVPGYSGAGTVVEVGPTVTRFRVGDHVAGPLPHASATLMDEATLVRVAHATRPEHAAFVQLGVISLQGLRKAKIQLGETVAVIGPGLIGLLVTQLAAQSGAGQVITIARSAERLDLASKLGATRTVDLSDPTVALDGIAADVTLDTTGNPDAVHTAIACTRPGGRIVLLGSNRGVTRAADFDRVLKRGITLIGAHIESLPKTESSAGSWTSLKEAETFLELLNQDRVQIAPLITHHLRPSEAERFYRQLSRSDHSILGAVFRWDGLSDHERLRARRPVGSLVKRPDQHHIENESTSAKPLLADELRSTHLRLPSANGAYRLLRVGLIGCGEIAMQNAKASQEAENTIIAMVADVNAAIAADMGRRFHVPSTHNVDELLARDDIDAVLISVPHYLHAPLTIRAAEFGKHVMVEKPMATSVADADRMIAACRSSGVRLSVIYCQRYLPYVQRAKHLIESGALGNILGVQLDFRVDKPTSYYASGFSGRVHSDWRVSPEKSGGGLLIFNLVHYLDMIRHLTNLEVSRVSAESGALDTPIETEDTISVTLRYSNDAIASIMGSSVVRGSAYQPGLRLWGTDGQLDLREPDDFRFYSLRQIGDYRPGAWHSFGKLGAGADRREYVSRFAKSVFQDVNPPVTAEDARAIQAIVEAIYTACTLHTSVEVDKQ